jgi:hypothetical protein
VVEQRELMRFSEQIKGKFILACDLNAHHYQWGSTKNTVEGKCIRQCLSEEEGQITLLNDVSITHISEGHASESVLDLTFVDSGSSLDYSWIVKNDNWGSYQ